MTPRTRRTIGWFAGLLPAWIVSFAIISGPVLAGISFGISNPAPGSLYGGIAHLLLPYYVARRFFDGPPTLYVLLMVLVAGIMQWVFKRVSGETSIRAGTLAAIGWSAVAGLSPVGTYIVRYLPYEPLIVVLGAFLISFLVTFTEAFVVTAVFGQLIAAPFLRRDRAAGPDPARPADPE